LRRQNRRSAEAAALLAATFCLTAGCGAPPGAPSTTAAAVSAVSAPTGAPAAPASKIQPSGHEPFDGARAMDLLKKQCDFGVRPLGSEAHEKLKDYLIAQMKKYADVTRLQQFKYRSMPVTNVVGVIYPAGSDKPAERPVLLMTHWDTRPIADGPFSTATQAGTQFRYGPTGWKPEAPIMGANDAASGVAVLLELARLFKEKRPPVGVILLLDDGEDYGDFTANNNRGDGVELGARYFAKNFRTDKVYGQPAYGILLDMVGAKNAFFVPEALSESSAPSVNQRVFHIGQSLGYGDVFRSTGSQSVGDDHVSINEAGIPTIDLIHPLPYQEFANDGYRFWHTLQDTPDKCSATTLKAVGDTIAETIYREAPSN
jgi:glutaminyl-peptide cyclotransferase